MRVLHRALGALAGSVLAWGAAASAAPAAPPACQFAKVGELPVTMVGEEPLVTAKVNGKDGLFLIDTGSFYSFIGKDGAAKYDLKTYAAPSDFFVAGVAGVEKASIAKVAEFSYAGIPIKQISFLVDSGGYGPGVVGVIGQNLLGAVDVEYDLANGMIRLFQARDCEQANLAYWSAGKPFSMLTSGRQSPRAPHIIVDAKVNGYAIRAMMDTGAGRSILERAAARRAGIDMSDANLKPSGYSSGFGGGAAENWIGGVSSFSIGDEEIKNTRLRMGNIDIGADMLVGADFFLSHRVMVARSQHRVYFTYNGGPVFRLSDPAKIADASAATATPSDGTPASADELARRGAASAARNDMRTALADISRAIDMEPKNGDFRLQRARMRLKADDKPGALKDMDQAAALKPDDQQVFLARAELRLKLKDAKGGQEDFLTAIKLAPEDKELPLTLAGRLAYGHAADAAVRLLDGWLLAHPTDELAPAAFGGRCWARALGGIELDQALKDCDEAHRRNHHNGDDLDSRALVSLRMGRYDEAIGQYNQVIFDSPRSAWSLYARGVAKAKRGRAAEAKADIAAATAIDKDIAETAAGFGIAP